jgi:monothiol glutaredoxin
MRDTLPDAKIDTHAARAMESFHSQTVAEVKMAVSQNRVVVVGMKQNPFVSKVRKLLKEKSIPFEYLEYGSYTSKWKPRLAIKLWSGWPTFPQVYVEGKLIGGFAEISSYLQEGRLK